MNFRTSDDGEENSPGNKKSGIQELLLMVKQKQTKKTR